jgi:large subunit ribosomal protein LX
MNHQWQSYSKELVAKDDAAAREKLLSLLGSHHGVNRKNITIAKVEEVPKDQIEDHAVRYALEVRA